MPMYGFRAVAWDGGVVNGYVVGSSLGHIRHKLHAQNIDLLSVHRVWLWSLSQRAVSRFFVSLGHALQAGHPLLQALDMISMTCGRQAKPMIHSIRDHVAQGHVLSQALMLHGDVFSEVVRARLVVGEETGQLTQACYQVHAYLETQHQRHQQWARTLVYPAINGVALLGVLIMLSSTLLPEMTQLVHETGQSLSTTLSIMQRLGEPWVGGSILAVVLGASLAAWRLPHWIPWVRTWVAHQQYSTFFSGVALLLKTHMPLFQALTIMSRQAKSVPTSRTTPLLHALTQGQSLHHAVARWPFLDAMSLSYIQVGEQTGQMVASLDLLVRSLDDSIQHKRQQVMTWTTPCALVLMGAVLWLVIDGAMMPLYDLWSFPNG